jgi:membrane associated rhomboid family serine protease
MIPLVGASGAIAGILGAYLAAFPGTRVHVLVFLIFFIQIVRVPALLVLGGWFVIQVFSATAESAGGSGVAWYAHIVGFIVGYLLMRKRIRKLVSYSGGRWEF